MENPLLKSFGPGRLDLIASIALAPPAAHSERGDQI